MNLTTFEGFSAFLFSVISNVRCNRVLSELITFGEVPRAVET